MMEVRWSSRFDDAASAFRTSVAVKVLSVELPSPFVELPLPSFDVV